VIILAGGLMSIRIDKLREFIERLRDEARKAAAGGDCKDEVTALNTALDALEAMADASNQC